MMNVVLARDAGRAGGDSVVFSSRVKSIQFWPSQVIRLIRVCSSGHRGHPVVLVIARGCRACAFRVLSDAMRFVAVRSG
jgi:hypothetical protein